MPCRHLYHGRERAEEGSTADALHLVRSPDAYRMYFLRAAPPESLSVPGKKNRTRHPLHPSVNLKCLACPESAAAMRPRALGGAELEDPVPPTAPPSIPRVIPCMATTGGCGKSPSSRMASTAGSLRISRRRCLDGNDSGSEPRGSGRPAARDRVGDRAHDTAGRTDRNPVRRAGRRGCRTTSLVPRRSKS